MKKSMIAWTVRVMKWTTPHAKLIARRLASVTRRSLIADILLARATVPFISAYRVLLSPHKGFRCAHAVMTGGPSCSDIALNAFKTTTFASAVVIVDEQFAECRHSYLANCSNLIDEGINHLPNLSGAVDYAISFGIECCNDDDGL